MTGVTALSRPEASAAVEALGWRYLLDRLTTVESVQSFAQVRDVIDTIVTAGLPDVDDHLSVHAARDHVELTLQTAELRRVTARDVAIADQLTAALRTRGLNPSVRYAGRSVQALEIAIDVMNVDAVRPFWKAVLDYKDLSDPGGGGELVDPRQQGPRCGFSRWASRGVNATGSIPPRSSRPAYV